MSPAVFQGRSLWGSTFMCSCKVSVGSWHCTVSWMVDVLSSWSYEFPSTQAMYPKMTYFWVSLIEQVTLFGNTPLENVLVSWDWDLTVSLKGDGWGRQHFYTQSTQPTLYWGELQEATWEIQHAALWFYTWTCWQVKNSGWSCPRWQDRKISRGVTYNLWY